MKDNIKSIWIVWPTFIGTIFAALIVVSPAKAQDVSALCSPKADYFEARTFPGSFTGSYPPEKDNASEFDFVLKSLASWVKNPIKCKVKTILRSHMIELRAVDYFPAGASQAACSGSANATIEVFLDGEIFYSKEKAYGFCQPMQTVVQFDGTALSVCYIPDLGASTDMSAVPKWALGVEGEGEMQIYCKRLNLEGQDARR